jgi:hypothetical protein
MDVFCESGQSLYFFRPFSLQKLNKEPFNLSREIKEIIFGCLLGD